MGSPMLEPVGGTVRAEVRTVVMAAAAATVAGEAAEVVAAAEVMAVGEVVEAMGVEEAMVAFFDAIA